MMRTLVASELLKLRVTRSTWWLVAVGLALGVLRTAGVVLTMGTASGVERGTADATLTIAGAMGAGLLVLLVLAVVAASGEYRHATISGSVLVVPDRKRLAVAKCLAVSSVGVGYALLLWLLGVAVALVTGVGGAPRAGDLLAVGLANVVVGVAWSCIGVGIGLLVTSQTVAVLLPIVWLVVVETLVGSSGLTALRPWLPGGLPGQLLPSAPGAPGPVVAALLLVGYGLAAGGAGARRLARRELS